MRALAVVLVALAVVPAQPKPKETVAQTVLRIQVALQTKGCTPKLKALFHSAYGKVAPTACDYLRKGLGSFKLPRGASYKTGAVIDYGTGYTEPGTAALALDRDGKFHVAFVDFTFGTIGTKPNGAFDRNARLAVDAVRRGDCRAFLAVAYRKFGLGGGGHAAVCARLAAGSLHRQLASDPKAKLVKLGGNSYLAFYGLTVAKRYYTVIMAQQSPSPKIPVDAAKYAYVNAYPA